MKLFKRRNPKALARLKRQTSFNNIINLLAGHRGGRTFAVDTKELKYDPPRIVVTERFSPVRLKYIKEVAALVSYEDRKMSIEVIDNSLTYIVE
jgi:hypothetical protein